MNNILIFLKLKYFQKIKANQKLELFFDIGDQEI